MSLSYVTPEVQEEGMQDLGWLTGSGVHELSRVWLVCSMWDLSSLTRV